MSISESELKKLIGDVRLSVEKITTLSDDGRNLLSRVPQKIRDHLKLSKGDKLRWTVDLEGQIKIGVIKDHAKE
jgi:hypothetical protein